MRKRTVCPLLTIILACLLALPHGHILAREDLTRPAWLGKVSMHRYDGKSDDLLTAGLGKSGLGSALPPPPLPDPAASLRRLAIYSNYRALVDTSEDGGYGRLFGPNVSIDGKPGRGEGMIPGTEYLAYADDGSGQQNVTLMVQVPDAFDPAHPCIIAAPSSGSRGVYGAIATAGEWGLKHGCTVAYTDKGTGNGIHDLEFDTVSLQNGLRTGAIAAGHASNFTAPISENQRLAYALSHPGRFAFKHAHSQQNPEKDWGRNTLQAIEFALYLLRQRYGSGFNAGAAITIAAGVSNGGGAALAAAEQDKNGLIKGVAVGEPNVSLEARQELLVQRGARVTSGSGKQLFDYITQANLFQPCAALATPAANAFNTVWPSAASARCRALADLKLVQGDTDSARGRSAQQVLADYGYEPESAPLHAAMFAFATPALAAAFGPAYGRFSVLDDLCGWSFAGPSTLLPTSFATGNGIAPTLGISIVRNGVGGIAIPLEWIDYDLDGARCARELATGHSANAQRVRQGVIETRRHGKLGGRPAIIVHGRADTLIPVGFSSRPYYGVNQILEGEHSQLRYIEVTNAQHFDAFLDLPGFAENYVPLHVYFVQALDLVYAALRSGTPLPESQVVRTLPRGKDGLLVRPLMPRNLPSIVPSPLPADQIRFTGQRLTIPD